MKYTLSVIIINMMCSSAFASSYCWWSGSVLGGDGSIATDHLKIVISSVPREPIPGKPTNRPWCLQERKSLGGHSTNTLIEKPKLGEVRLNGYQIRYKGNKIGHDRFSVERKWLNWTNNTWQKGVITYDVDIVPDPF